MALRNVLKEISLAGALLIIIACSAFAQDQTLNSSPTQTLAPVTLSATGLDLNELLTMLSRSRNINIVCHGDVSGPVSIDLHDVPFFQALKSVVAIAGFEVVRKDNIYFVRAPQGESGGLSAINETKTFRLDYAKTSDILPVIQELLSSDGKAIAYPPIRSIVVEDNSEVLEQIEILLQSLDVAPRQVFIEARVLEARLSDDMSFGIDWTLLFTTDEGNGETQTSGMASDPTGGNPGLYVSWGAVDFTSKIEATAGVEELSTISAPRLLATDGAEAEIIIGGQLGFMVLTTVENAVMQSVEFLDTGAQLKLTPTITGNGFIMMDIHPELSDGVVESGVPAKTTTQVSSNVLVADGETIFIGGLIREREEESRKGIPLLMDIPLLGAFFGRTVKSVQKEEIIVLITPRIVQPGEVIDQKAPFGN